MSHFSQQAFLWRSPTTPKSQMEDQDQEHTHPHPQPQESQEQEMEHMFEKPLTPSDVGKLNRLVIPKQHAEKYLPLSRFDSVEKGLLLSFEDELRKQWRFRYSYWNSSQSYVLTKGWSRFVKEKQLDAGDVVSFERQRGGQLCIRWRRRSVPAAQELVGGSGGWSGSGVYYSAVSAAMGGGGGGYSSHHHHPHGPLLYQPDCLHAAAAQPDVQKPVMRSKRQVRLFGVNLDCQHDEPEPPGPDAPSFSGQGRAHFLYSQGHELNHNIQQDFNFSREYHQTRNYLGGSGDVPI